MSEEEKSYVPSLTLEPNAQAVAAVAEEEKKDEGDYVVIGFKLVEEGRTYVVGCEALLKAE